LRASATGRLATGRFPRHAVAGHRHSSGADHRIRDREGSLTRLTRLTPFGTASGPSGPEFYEDAVIVLFDGNLCAEDRLGHHGLPVPLAQPLLGGVGRCVTTALAGEQCLEVLFEGEILLARATLLQMAL